MDEFQRVETKVVRDILSETRKFNLYAYLSMQYLGQMQKEIHDSIVSNIRNIVSFKLNKQDATMISSIMEIKIEESFKKARTQTELEESKKEMFVRLHQRECIVRLFDGKKYILPMKLHVVDVARWGYTPSMELSKMDAMHDTPNEQKPPEGGASQSPPAQSQPPAQGQSSAFSVQYSAQATRKPVAKPEEPEEEKQGQGEENQEEGQGQEEKKDNPFEPQQQMDETELMIAKDDDEGSGIYKKGEKEDEEAEEEPAEEQEGAAEEKGEALEKKMAKEREALEKELSDEEGLDEEESPTEDEEPTDDDEPAPTAKKTGRRGMVKVDFDDFEEEAQKPSKKRPRALAEEYEPEKPVRAKKGGKKPKAEEEKGEAPLSQVMDDDAIMAEKLRRIREKAMKLQMERELRTEAEGAQKSRQDGEKADGRKGAAGKKATGKKSATKKKR
jgi:hypothetical protein